MRELVMQMPREAWYSHTKALSSLVPVWGAVGRPVCLQ